jgi:DNA primase (bacterial type)
MPYIPFTDEQKQLANSVDLAEYLRVRGEKLERAGIEHKLIYYDSSGKHDSITIRGSKWFDHKNQTGGGAIKFMQEFYDMDFQTAVQELLGQRVTPLSNSPPKADKQEQKTREFKLPEANSNMHRVYAYLIKQRFIAPEVITHFAKQHTLYEDKEHHNAVFVGVDENGVPRQASKRSTSTFGNAFRITCEGSDTKYSFAHFGESKRLYVFEAPIDMMSFLTLYPKDWQKHSCIAMNGVYENAVLTALKNHSNLREIVLCVDNDEGGIEAVDRLRDILHENGYPNVKRLAPEFKDWNECLKSQNGVEPLPAVPHKRKDEYLKEVSELGYLKCRTDKLTSQIYATFKNGQYKYLAEYALAGSAFFMPKSERINSEFQAFERLHVKLKGSYKPYTDKGKKSQKQRNLQECVQTVLKDLRQTARTREQSVNTAKLLYQLADSAVRLSVEETLNAPMQENIESEYIVSEAEQCMEFG